MTPTVMIVEDDPVIAEDIRACVYNLGYNISGITGNKEKAKSEIKHHKPNLIILDISLGENKSGIDLAHWINFNHPLPFIFLTGHSDSETIDKAQKTHPWGYVVKPFTDTDIRIALSIALSNFNNLNKPQIPQREVINTRLNTCLTSREFDVLCRLMQGKSNREIADDICLSENTIKSHLQHLFDKLNVNNRAQIIMKIMRL